MGESGEVQTLPTQIDAVIKAMEAIEVSTDEQYAFTAGWCKKCKETQAVVKAHFAPDIAEAQKKLDDKKAEQASFITRLTAAEVVAKKKMSDYWTAKETKRLEEERRLQEEKRKQIEADRLALAMELSAAGKEEKADALLDRKIRVGKVETVSMAAPKIAGVSFRENWSANVVNLTELIEAVAAGKAPEILLQPCASELNAAARLARKEGEIFPGVVAVMTKTVAVG